MKNFLKKFHVVTNQEEDGDGSNSSRASKSSDVGSVTHKLHEHKPFSGFSTWLNSVTNRKSPSPPSSSNVAGGGRRTEPSESVSSAGLDVTDSATRDSGSNSSRDPGVEEEYQIQIALEMSVKEDPEAVEIEAVKQISLGSSASENTPAEVVAYRYWNYNALTYDDKIVDGFYDLYGIVMESKLKSMPSLIDLQGTPLSEVVTWEAVLVNRAADANLLKLEEKALEIAFKSRREPVGFFMSDLVKKIAILVSDYMGGTVEDSESMFRAWQSLSHSLKSTLGSMVLPLGSLTTGLARHRALMFKVLADDAGIPCRLVKGHLYTGSDDVAMNFVKIEDGREYIVDLMADPGTLIPADATGLHVDYDDSFFPSSPLSRDIDSSRNASSSSGVSSSGVGSSFEEHSGTGTFEKRFKSKDAVTPENQSHGRSEPSVPPNISHQATSWEGPKVPVADSGKFSGTDKMLMQELPGRPNYPYAHARSPSWTEGISSPAARRMKVKDVSEYMIDAAKENPNLAQKLHDVLLESGVVAPPNLFTEVFHKQSDVSTSDESIDCFPRAEGQQKKDGDNVSPKFLPPLPHQKPHPKFSNPSHQLELPKLLENVGANHPGDVREVSGLGASSQSEVTPTKYVNNVPVAAAAAAAAAVVASSMVVAARSNLDTNLELPAAAAAAATATAAAAATATAAAVVATTVAVSKYEQGVCTDEEASNEADDSGNRGSGAQESHDTVLNTEVERISDSNDSSKSDRTMDDVEEIQWDEILLGERIGLGSYGEVYHGEWRGTEVAVKRFLDQDISGQSLLEFRSEVKLMQRLRHPNVVLFMGAVTRPPNLSIVTEFLPRGSLYRLIHRPNNQLDKRRRLRMALDTARGMNYLHSCSPVVVHRDLKSPNLLVDRNWVVKVCDFGLSRMKLSTFLSSRSTAGTAEWMAPEVLRNEPSDEKCDVYSYGVILWELCTMQQPWWGMNPMQVVGAVGFQHRRLDIPNDIDPAVANIIRQCWQTDPRLRPSFAEIMAALKPLQKPITNPQVPRPVARGRSEYDKGRPSEEAED